MRRVLSALVLAMLVLVLAAAPTPAKGPTHMLLMSPNGGFSPGGSGAYEFMELSDSRAQEIEVLLDDLGQKVTEPEYERWHEVQVAWTMHAFEIFRSDIVFLDGKGAAVMMTLRSGFEEEGFSTDWRRVRDGAALTALFTEMGLVGDGPSTKKSSTTKKSETEVAAAAAPTTSAGSSDASAGGDGTRAWGWALPGLLAGLVLGVLGAALVSRRTPQAFAQRFARS